MRSRNVFGAALLALAGGWAVTAVGAEGERLAVFDLGSLDTLDALGLGERVVAVPKQSLPDYLSRYGDEAYIDIGGLRSPDLEAVADASPSLIVMTGRQGDWHDEFAALAPLFDASVSGPDYLAAVEGNVRDLAGHLDAAEEAEAAIETLHGQIEQARQALADAPAVLVATHNGGNLSLNAHRVVHEVLGLAQPELPDDVTSETRGARTFTPLSAEAVARIAPEVLLIVDRSAAIGDEPADLDALGQALAEAGGEGIRVERLSPALWYLSGGGLQSLALQIDEVVAALQAR